MYRHTPRHGGEALQGSADEFLRLILLQRAADHNQLHYQQTSQTLLQDLQPISIMSTSHSTHAPKSLAVAVGYNNTRRFEQLPTLCLFSCWLLTQLAYSRVCIMMRALAAFWAKPARQSTHTVRLSQTRSPSPANDCWDRSPPVDP